MNKIKIYQVDAFASQLFSGNSAAVCPLKKFLSEELMQSVAAENNLSETAFFVKNNGYYDIRWFTPETEIDLCGHATLATAYVIFSFFDTAIDEIKFRAKSGMLYAKKIDETTIQLNFPIIHSQPVDIVSAISNALTIKPLSLYKSDRDYFAVYENPAQILAIQPDFNKLHASTNQSYLY